VVNASQSAAVLRAVPQQVCDRHFHDYCQRNQFDSNGQPRPEKEVREEALKKLSRSHLLQRVEGTPAWWGTQLSDLKAMSRKFGLPDLFLTLTEDEVSDTRFQEINDIEHWVRHCLGLPIPGIEGPGDPDKPCFEPDGRPQWTVSI
jgi:hypothetical protein